MDFENNENNPSDISHFLDQFEKENSELEKAFAAGKVNFYTALDPQKTDKTTDKDQSFKKLENKVTELEEKFETSLKEKQALLSELAKSKEDKEKEKGREEFFQNISSTIANLKESVDRLSRAQQPPPSYITPGYYYGAPIDQASKIGQEQYFAQQHEFAQKNVELVKAQEEVFIKKTIIKDQQGELALSAKTIKIQKEEIEQKGYEADRHKHEAEMYRHESAQHKLDKEEKERLITSLKEKAGRLKAVNTALEKEFKRVQDEKIEVLRKSAEQAKEILSLRDQLTKAEERFKSFDFEGRILSIKNHYKQKVSNLEGQLQEVSAQCMKQVEEIENLKTDNLRLKNSEIELAALNAKYEEKNKEVYLLKAQVEQITSASAEALLNVNSAQSSAEKMAEENVIRLSAVLEETKASGVAARAKAEDAQANAEKAQQENRLLKEKLSEKEIELAHITETEVKNITRNANEQIAALNTRLLEVQRDRDAIAKQIDDISHKEKGMIMAERKRYEDMFKSLMQKIKDNDGVIENLKNKIEVLDTENKDLKTYRPAAGQIKKAKESASPALTVIKEEAAPAAPQYPNTLTRNTPTRAKAAALDENYAESEKDFLEDTQTFLGRIKWSLMKDD